MRKQGRGNDTNVLQVKGFGWFFFFRLFFFLSPFFVLTDNYVYVRACVFIVCVCVV